MEINNQSFIFGKPVSVPFGKIRFLTVEEYLSSNININVLGLNQIHLYYIEKKKLQKTLKRKELYKLEELKSMMDEDLYDVVMKDDLLLSTYLNIFSTVVELNEPYQLNDLFATKDIFMFTRDVIMKMNFVKEEKAFKNEELQELHEVSMQLKNKGQKMTLEDMITSVRLATGDSYKQIGESTVYQLNADFLRACAKVDYDTSTLFATVSSEAPKIEHWTKHIDLMKESSDGSIKESDFKANVNKAFE